MKPLVTAQEMRELDRRTITEACVPGLLLMEAASRSVADAACCMLGGSPAGKRIAVFCGRGNNGGDGFAAARHLSGRKADVSVFLAGDAKSLKGDALANFSMLRAWNVPVVELHSRSGLRKISPGDLIIDALLGTGISGDVVGVAADAIQWINRSGCPVLSVDMPSGLSGDTGRFGNACVRADRTVTFGCMKRGLTLHPGREYAGQVKVADIGIPESVASSVEVKTFLVEVQDIAPLLPKRPPSAHKGTFGKVLILAGSTGMTGAGVLCSMSVLKAGAGLAILGVPASLNPIFEEKLTEVMTRPLSETESGSLSMSAENEIRALLNWADAAAIGPGISRNSDTAELARRVILKNRKPMVADADGINAFEGKSGLLKNKKGVLVLTPHAGELSRLTGKTLREIEADRIESARTAAQQLNCVMVLKGAPTVTAGPDGRVFVNSTGNSGMATAGAGDVLTGIITGLLAQGASAVHAAVCGVYMHGLAGDLAAAVKTERSLIAGDIPDYLGAAFKRVEDS